MFRRRRMDEDVGYYIHSFVKLARQKW